jgi:hypothetical protein
MTKRVLGLWIILVCLLGACGAQTIVDDSPANVSQAVPANPAGAYYAAFLDLRGRDSGLDADLQYLAVDLAGCQLDNTADLVKLLQAYCAQEHLTLLLETMEGLEAKGYLKDYGDAVAQYFPDGVLYSFEDVSLSDKKLVSAVQKWRTPLGAYGETVTVSLQKDGWEVTKVEAEWIS